MTPMAYVSPRHGRRAGEVHTTTTRAQTLEEACDIIEAHQRAAKVSAKALSKPRTLKQQMVVGKLRAQTLKMQGKISLGGGGTNKPDPRLRQKARLPHPLRDLDMEAKRVKAREMFASGAWGFAVVAVGR